MLWNSTKAKVGSFPDAKSRKSLNLLIIRFNFGKQFQFTEKLNQFRACDRLSVQRLRTLQQKKEAQAKANRRDIATLIEKGRLETARIKVENSA